MPRDFFLAAAALCVLACAGPAPAPEELAAPNNYAFDLTAKRAALKAAARPLDWSALLESDARVYYVGEAHYNPSIRRELGARMAEFRAAGITHLAVEVPYFEQPVIDRYLKNPADEDAARQLLADLKERRIIVPEEMFRLIASAAAAKIEVLAIDQSFAGGKAAFDAQPREFQNEWMAQSLDTELAGDSQAKILVLLGYGHLTNKTQSHWLSDHGWRSKRYIFLTPGLEPARASKPLCILDPAHYEFFAALKGSSLWGKRLFIPQSEFDGYIVDPETLEEDPLPRDRGPATWCVKRSAP